MAEFRNVIEIKLNKNNLRLRKPDSRRTIYVSSLAIDWSTLVCTRFTIHPHDFSNLELNPEGTWKFRKPENEKVFSEIERERETDLATRDQSDGKWKEVESRMGRRIWMLHLQRFPKMELGAPYHDLPCSSLSSPLINLLLSCCFTDSYNFLALIVFLFP